MASNKETSTFFKVSMSVLILISVIITFKLFTPSEVEKRKQVKKPVAVAEVTVADRVVRSDVRTVDRVIHSDSNGPVMVTVKLDGLNNNVEVK
jgi:hypothetical protein